MNQTKRTVFVYADWQGMIEPLLMGTLSSELLRGKEIFSFQYEESWVKSNYAQVLDPDLELYTGVHYPTDKKSNFGLFLDSSPDRWGRLLMRRREAAIAHMEHRPEQSLYETDYLLGVFDGHRMGALRFKLDRMGPFVNDNGQMATPPWTSIRELEEISLHLEKDDVSNDPEYFNWLTMLASPGSSLGGARPKASVLDSENQLWIAKFPSGSDLFDIGGWEAVTYEMAIAAGINMSESQAKRFSNKHHTFLTKRFDRTGNGARIHFASALTMLGFKDGQDHKDGLSYLDLVDFITSHGANVDADLEQLWKRIVFSIFVSNTDDHLRNHGFVFTPRGWILSPAYDINPVETGTGLSLNISENDNSLNLDLALSVRDFFRLSENRSTEIIKEIATSVKGWRSIAKKYGISNFEADLKKNAFERVTL